MRLAQRFVLGAMLLVGALVVFLVLIADRRLRHRLESEAVQQLAREARLVATRWSESADPDALADTAGVALGHRVTLIGPGGRVLGDSEFGGEALRQLGNLASRPEVIAARREGLGRARGSDAFSRPGELHVAVPVHGGGIVRVSLGTRRMNEIASGARRDLLVAGLAALLAAVALAYVFARALSRPIVELRDVAGALAAGDLTRRPALSAPGEVGDLAQALHRMADQLAGRLQALQAEDALMAAVIESLHEGVLAVDARRRVVRINRSGRRLLAAPDPIPFPTEQLPRDRTLREALEAALAGERATGELRMEGRTLALTALPLAGGGAVLAFYDLTKIRRLEAVRRDFVANVSHELKTPLTVIGGFAETLLEEEIPRDQRRQFAETIRKNAQRMQRIVDDLLDLSRIESGGWVPVPRTVPLAEAAAEAIAPVRAIAAEKGVSLEIVDTSGVPPVHADPTALRQVLGNLVENAVRYTPRGGSVTVFAEAADGGVWVGVRDTGIGIAPEHLPRIFERFYRADPGRSRQAGGTGLGLAIVRHLVEAHGGTVRAESTPGRGTAVLGFFPGPGVTES